jgi:hypothetical protein
MHGRDAPWVRENKKIWRLREWVKGFLTFAMASSDEGVRSDSEAFSDYLDSYFNSFDFYPACSRHVFQRNDAFALWQDFLLVTGDLSTAADRMQANPEKFLNLKGWMEEDVKTRKEQIAREIRSRIAAKKSTGR